LGKKAHPETRAFHAVVRGRVQGVGFRWSAVREARRLGLRGSVANLPDGSVEVRAEGEAETLALFLAWLERGPQGARVHSVDSEWVAPTGAWVDFDVDF
jgi:acylphosphatase